MRKQIVTLAAVVALSVGAANQVAASSVHTVQPGDTLWSISNDNHVSVENLQAWNDLDSPVIYPSQTLKIDDKVNTYVVVKGDTLFKIAERHNVSVSELKNRNDITGDVIHPGDQLVVEGSKAFSTPVLSNTVTNAPTSSTAKEITVKATAYTAFCAGCSGVTATGIDLRSNPDQKVIAVDPAVIPLGTRVWVEGYGEAIAGDIGSAIIGKSIDVFIPNEQDALNWGNKTVTIKILN